MKSIITIILLVSFQAQAWKSTDPSKKDYVFKYKMAGNSLEIKRSAPSYEDAFEGAAQECFKYYKGQGRVSEDRGLDIIDVCANPRS